MYQWELGLVVAVLLTHGIGHGLGLFPVFGWARAPNWSNRSWLIGNSGTARVFAVLIWSTAIVAFVGAALGCWAGQPCWGYGGNWPWPEPSSLWLG